MASRSNNLTVFPQTLTSTEQQNVRDNVDVYSRAEVDTFIAAVAGNPALMNIRAKKTGVGYSLNHSFIQASQMIDRDYGVALWVTEDEITWECYNLWQIGYSGENVACLIFKSVNELNGTAIDNPNANIKYYSIATLDSSNTLTLTQQETCRTETI